MSVGRTTRRMKYSLCREDHYTTKGVRAYKFRCSMRISGIRVLTGWTTKPKIHHFKLLSNRAKILNLSFAIQSKELLESSSDSSSHSSSSWYSRSTSRSRSPPLIRAKTPPPPLMSVNINKELVEHAARVKNLPSLLQGMKLSDMNMAGPSQNY